MFTSGATEANNLALNILGAEEHLITSNIEHKAILEPAKGLEASGIGVTLLTPDSILGTLNGTQIAGAIKPDTRLVSVMYVNNETGASTPLKEISRTCDEHNVLLHTDAAQAAAWVPLDTESLDVDMMSLSAHKFYGPRGIGILYVRDTVVLSPQILGGAQERGRRGGTENVAAAVGMATAMDLIVEDQDTHACRIYLLRQELQEQLLVELGDQLIVNTPPSSAPHVLNVAFKPMDDIPLDGEMLLLNLDLEGIYTSAGSACTSGAISPSHVLLGLGVPEHTARASLRLSLGRSTTREDIARTVECICNVVKRMRGQRRNGE
ncbi:MAG: cysteine desulfurase family protein [Bacteroidetes bacterium]|nr:cysteine desulfurase family protein [Bacteroidota bacterium]